MRVRLTAVVGRILRAALYLAIGGVAACEESSIVPPHAPSPLSAESVGVLTIACPEGGQAQSLDGRPVPMTYPPPEVTGGEVPVSVSCSPASDSRFPVGTTKVRCSASDRLGQTARCTFAQVVLPPPMLGVTSIVAFGDSLTAGVVSAPVGSAGRLAEHVSYPRQLEQRLATAYPLQRIRVVNEGRPAELAAAALPRLRAILAARRPEVVLLMEGTNDLGLPMATGDAAFYAIEMMLGAVQAAGAAPVLATIPPIRPTGGRAAAAARVEPYNRRIRALAAARGVPLVDVHGVLVRGGCSGAASSGLPCIGQDDLHPTARGYELIADAFFDYLVEAYDMAATSSLIGPPQSSAWSASGPSHAMGARQAGAVPEGQRE